MLSVWILSATHQSVSRLVLINGTDPGPIEVHQKRHARRVELVLRRHHPKEIWKAVVGEHRVRVSVAKLQQNSYAGDQDKRERERGRENQAVKIRSNSRFVVERRGFQRDGRKQGFSWNFSELRVVSSLVKFANLQSRTEWTS